MINLKIKNLIIVGLIILLSISASAYFFGSAGRANNKVIAEDLRLDDQEATIRAIKKVMPAVASIIVYDNQKSIIIDLNTGKQTNQVKKEQIGSGTGFIISPDGLILTNKHVVNAATSGQGDYRVILNSGKQYYAQLIGTDPVNDLAVLKIFDKNLPYVQLGDSDKLQIGSTVIAIGNALGRYQNSATKGIISGLGRSIVASDQSGASAEGLDNVIQTDAEINPGNSGGPLIDLSGNVVGINVAIDQSAASIGFAIPVNDAKAVINSVKTAGRIIRPRIGIRYLMITSEIAQENNLQLTSGAWIVVSQDGTSSIVPGAPAETAGLQNGDIITEINGVKLEGKNTLLSAVQKYKPGDKITLKVVRNKNTMIKTVVLDQFK